jgi:K+-transporting ATPase ATPase C chain
MLTEIKRAIAFTAVAMLVFGGAYHAVLWGVGRALFGSQAEGSVIRRANGAVIGSRQIAQAFTRLEYFHPRPSGAAYDAASAGGTNYGPSNPEHLNAVEKRLRAIAEQDQVAVSQVPSEMVTASGSGLDPHIPPSAARLQIRRVATARGVSFASISALIQAHTEPPTFGFLGRARVNVLDLNLALDEMTKRR